MSVTSFERQTKRFPEDRTHNVFGQFGRKIEVFFVEHHVSRSCDPRRQWRREKGTFGEKGTNGHRRSSVNMPDYKNVII